MFKITPLFPKRKLQKQTSTSSMNLSSSEYFQNVNKIRLVKILASRNKEKYNSEHKNNKQMTKSSKFKSTNASTFFNTTSNFLNLSKIDKIYRLTGTQRYQTPQKQNKRISQNILNCSMAKKPHSPFHQPFSQLCKLSKPLPPLQSSNLSLLYENLYNLYQSIPFIQSQSQQNLTPIKQLLVIPQEDKIIGLKKQFRIYQRKEVHKQDNLRRQIKCLTKETDQILGGQWKDTRMSKHRQ